MKIRLKDFFAYVEKAKTLEDLDQIQRVAWECIDHGITRMGYMKIYLAIFQRQQELKNQN